MTKYYKGVGTMSDMTVTLPSVQITLEQLIGAVRQLDAESRSIVLDALLDEDLDHRLDLFIERLARKPPSDDLSDEEINEIVHEVRRERRGW